LGVAVGLAPQFAFLLAEYIGGTEILKNPAYAASAIAYDHVAVWMRDRLAMIKELSGGIFSLAIIGLAVGVLALRRPSISSLPLRVLRAIGAAAFIASIATTFTLATGNPAWEPAPDARLRAELRGAMHDAVALNLQKEMTAEPPVSPRGRSIFRSARRRWLAMSPTPISTSPNTKSSKSLSAICRL